MSNNKLSCNGTGRIVAINECLPDTAEMRVDSDGYRGLGWAELHRFSPRGNVSWSKRAR